MANANYEYGDSILRDWARDMFAFNNKDKYPNKFDAWGAFTSQVYGQDANLTRLESFSEGAFIYACWARAFIPGKIEENLVGPFAEAVCMESWRRSVFSRRGQRLYDALQEQIRKTIQAGADPVSFFPEMWEARPAIEVLEDVRCKWNIVPREDIIALLMKVEPKGKGPGNDSGPGLSP